jgi:hypothetical protein
MANVITENITKTPEVCGGKACVAGSRVRVMDIVIWHERLGWSADEIVFEGKTVVWCGLNSISTMMFCKRRRYLCLRLFLYGKACRQELLVDLCVESLYEATAVQQICCISQEATCPKLFANYFLLSPPKSHS